MKREDEIGGGIGGSKIRKYASLLKRILEEKPDCVVVEGSLNSNNLLGLLPVLSSFGISFKVATPVSNSPTRGNALWIKQITHNQDCIEIQSTNGHEARYYEEVLDVKKVFVVKEGAAQIEALPGILNIAQELVLFEKKHGLTFKELFIDAGTGITAIGLLAGLQLLKREGVKTVITLVAGTKQSFQASLKQFFQAFNDQHNTSLAYADCNFELIFPNTSKSFGSFNATLVKEWQTMMQELRIPIDLTYTAKHFFRVKKYLSENQGEGPSLIINASSHTACRNHDEILASTYPKKD